MDQESPPEVLPNEQVACCRNLNANISIDFYERMIEMHFYNSIVELSVDYLNCTRKFKDLIIQHSYEPLFYSHTSIYGFVGDSYIESVHVNGRVCGALVQFSCYHMATQTYR